MSSQLGVQSRRLFLVTTFTVVFHSLAFRATTFFQFGVQSHHLSSSAFRATIFFQFCIQSHYVFSVMAFKAFTFFNLAFRATSLVWCSEPSSSQYWRSEPSSTSVRRLEPSSILNFGIQSHHLLTARHSKSSSLLSYDVRSRFFLVWHLEMSVLSYGVQSFLLLLQFGVQSRISSLTFRVTILAPFDV